MLIQPLGYKPKDSNSFFAVNISYLTNLWMSRMGEVVRAGTLAKYEGISTSRVMGTVIVDRLLDMLTLLLIVGFSFIIQFDTLWGFLSKHIDNKKLKGESFFNNWLLWVVIGIGALAVFLIYYYKNSIKRLPYYEKVKGVVERLLEGFKTLKDVKSPAKFIFHSINIWVMYYLMTYFCFFSFAPTESLSPLAALTVFVFGTFGMIVPSPGGMGTYHVMAVAALTLFSVNSNDAFSFANIMFFSIQIFYNIVIGSASLILLPILNKGRIDAHELEEILEPHPENMIND
jgi:glycosyltransferase 2 family protein